LACWRAACNGVLYEWELEAQGRQGCSYGVEEWASSVMAAGRDIAWSDGVADVKLPRQARPRGSKCGGPSLTATAGHVAAAGTACMYGARLFSPSSPSRPLFCRVATP
jgi:hypothetical protein